MTLYSSLLKIVGSLIILLNGRPIVEGKDNIPKDEPYILACTHRTLLDPILLAMIIEDQEIAFMGKNSLFKIPLLKSILPKVYVFPVNREKPTPNTIKKAVKVMNEEGKVLGIFPSGSRYSTEIKSGTAFIQKLSKRDILPVTIQPPLNLKQFFSRQKTKIAFGEPIAFDKNKKYTKEVLAEIDQHMVVTFDQLDQQLTPGYHYIPK